jgi:hypothetical protein
MTNTTDTGGITSGEINAIVILSSVAVYLISFGIAYLYHKYQIDHVTVTDARVKQLHRELGNTGI